MLMLVERISHARQFVYLQCSECQSGEKTGAGKRQEPNVSTSVDVAVWLECTMNRVSDGDRSTSLAFLSCGTAERRDHRYSEGALPIRGDRHAVGDVQRHLDGGAGIAFAPCPGELL